MIAMSHDSSHPISSMQIPLESTKIVQEFPDPFLLTLVPDHLSHIKKGPKGLRDEVEGILMMKGSASHASNI